MGGTNCFYLFAHCPPYNLSLMHLSDGIDLTEQDINSCFPVEV